MKPNGIQLSLGQADTGVWINEGHPIAPIGIKLALHWGPLYKKVVKFWRYRLGQDWNTAPNAWKNEDDCWFTISLPFFVGPYLSVAFKNVGFYIGFKIDDDDGLIPTARFTLRRR